MLPSTSGVNCMSQPVKLSDSLVLDARLVGDTVERSIAGQVEFWASLGRSVELLLEGRQVLALRRSGGARPLSEILSSVDTTAGRKRLAAVLANRPYPHFDQHADRPGLLVRTEEDGSRTAGRFVNRVFVAVEDETAQPTKRKSGTRKGGKAVPPLNKAKSTRPKEREAWA